ncbi:serine hydrolase [Polyangium fumosum]|uniref:Serine hydrolase n=1 Tax=Polyangium fumosum TaxID=889272 RepID=A0A4U1IWK5_9BACT|nr:serine hydrolase [Polyangium fumosum]TKC98826.1 serine hydrolase [Polyangium fumosum]
MLRRSAILVSALLASACASAPPLPPDKPAPPPPVEASPARVDPLAGLDVDAAETLAAWKAPGMAIAVVRGDEAGGHVVLARGYGTRELGGTAPVDAHTRFPVASLTKTFTAAAVGKLVEDGKLGWDDPIKRHFPGFCVKDPHVGATLSIRDALAHRSGLEESADLLWLGTGFDRGEVIRRLCEVGQEAPLRAKFSYSNVLYTVAGELAARASGQTWEELVTSRLLDPAGMRESGFGAPAPGGENRASPHAERDGVLARIAPRDVTNIGPAAGLVTSAHDLARWLLLLLGRGTIEGKRVLAPEVVDALFTPTTMVGLRPWQKELYPESHFLAQGMGFMLQDYRGRLVAWGTGGIDGYSCSMALLPEEKLGIVVLTNVPFTGLPEGMVFRLVDAHLGAPPKDWSGKRLALSLASRARGAAARKERESKRETTSFPVPMEKFGGVYASPRFGDAVIEPRDGGLGLRFAKAARATLEPFRPGALLARFEDADLGTSLVTFTVDARGVVTSFSLEDHGAFTRVTR